MGGPPVRLLLVAAVLASTTPAFADDADVTTVQRGPASAAPKLQLGFATNFPLWWKEGMVGVSAYAGFHRHHAVRLNVARYRYIPNSVSDVIALATGNDLGDGPIAGGHLTDVVATYAYYPRRVFDGAFVEAGLLTRFKATTTQDDYDSPEHATATMTVAARGAVGWSWLMFDHAFIAIAVGASVGYERGYVATTPYANNRPDPTMTSVSSVSRDSASFEGMLRFGFAFGI